MRLIDIDPIIWKLKNAIYLGKRIGEDTANLEAVLADVEAAPTAEKKGRWEQVTNSDNGIDFRCSACHRYRFHNGEMRKKYNYCPNCGARMEP